jgi:D-3-phosphoglycerate dehydrogenase
MKLSAVLINTARGHIIDAKALYAALKQKQIAGACLDVFDIEPPLDKDDDLLKLDNVLLAPHVGFYTKEALERRAEIAFENIYKWLDGTPQNVVT